MALIGLHTVNNTHTWTARHPGDPRKKVNSDEESLIVVCLRTGNYNYVCVLIHRFELRSWCGVKTALPSNCMLLDLNLCQRGGKENEGLKKSFDHFEHSFEY